MVELIHEGHDVKTTTYVHAKCTACGRPVHRQRTFHALVTLETPVDEAEAYLRAAVEGWEPDDLVHANCRGTLLDAVTT